MKRVLVLTPAPNVPGGVANYYESIKLNQEENIDYFYIGSKNNELLYFPIFRFIRFINFYRILNSYDAVLINPSLDFKSFCRDSIYVLLAKRRKKKVFTFFRGWDTKFEDFVSKNFILKNYFKATFGKTDEFLVLGRVFEASLRNLLSPNIICHLETTVANNSFLDLFQPMTEKLKKPINILFLGRIVKSKGILKAIKIVEQINETKSNQLTLQILGDGPDFIKIKNQFQNQNIIFHGYLNGIEKYKIISESHILLFPTSYKEGLPNAILESMLFGLSIVTTAVAGIPDVIIDNENGFIIDPNNIDDCVKRIQFLLANEDLFIKMSEINHAKAVSNYTSNKVRIRILNILNA